MCRLRYSFAKTVWRFGTKTAPPRCFPMFIRKGRNTTLFGQIGLTKIGVIVMMTNKKAVASGLELGECVTAFPMSVPMNFMENFMTLNIINFANMIKRENDEVL